MKSRTSFKKLLGAIAGIAVLVAIVMRLYHFSSNSALRFNISIGWLISRNIFLFAGFTALSIGIFFRSIKNTGYAYPLISALNISTGVFCLIAHWLGATSLWWLHQCLLNWLIGLLMAADMIWAARN